VKVTAHSIHRERDNKKYLAKEKIIIFYTLSNKIETINWAKSETKATQYVLFPATYL
jgi:hypothetical protein